MAIIISIATQKGGVGKTTTTVNLAHAMASRRANPKKILVIDMDPQANASSILGTVPPEKQNINVTELFDNELAVAQHCIVPSKYKGIDLIASNLDLFVCGNAIGAGDPAAFMCLDKKLDIVTLKAYDYILIDCPPNIGGVFLNNALSCSDYYIIPVEASSIFSLNGVQQFMDAVTAIRRYTRRKLEMLGVLLTLYDKRTTAASTMESVLEDKFGGKLFKTKIVRGTDIDKAHMLGQSILDAYPRSMAAKCYRELAKEVLLRTGAISQSEAAADVEEPSEV